MSLFLHLYLIISLSENLQIEPFSPPVSMTFVNSSQEHEYTFTLEKGEFIRFEIRNYRNLFATIEHNGKVLTKLTGYWRNAFMIPFQAPFSGNYLLRIYSPKDAESQQSYTLRVLEKLSPNAYLAHENTQKCLPEVAWLEKNLQDIRTLDPDDDNFSDLQFLKEAIGSKRFVFLGEASHGSGSTLNGKLRLFKFLHQEMNFDTFVFEGGIYELLHFKKLLDQGNLDKKLRNHAVFPAWSYTKEGHKLLDYLTKNYTNGKLDFFGIDNQFHNGFQKELVSELLSFLEKISFDTSNYDNDFWGILDAYTNSVHHKTAPWPEVIKNKLLTDIMRLADELVQDNQTNLEAKLWKQVLISLHARAPMRFFRLRSCDDWWLVYNSQRDNQMAQNLTWLAKEIIPNRKVVIWGATSHFFRNHHLRRLADGKEYPNHMPMGDIFYQLFGDEMYTIGFTNYQGIVSWDSDISDKDSFLKDVVNKDQDQRLEFEELCAYTNKEFGFLDLTKMKDAPAWFHEPFLARAAGDHAYLGDWQKILDALVFVRESKPGSYFKYE